MHHTTAQLLLQWQNQSYEKETADYPRSDINGGAVEISN